MPTTNDIVVVTGAASGIGAALARRLHQRGARLVLADIDVDNLRELADELGAAARWFGSALT
ncbi:MAG: SDR family NAD(P)-dependent oxidoreductase [Acidimicrobiales bacterium]